MLFNQLNQNLVLFSFFYFIFLHGLVRVQTPQGKKKIRGDVAKTVDEGRWGQMHSTNIPKEAGLEMLDK